MMRHQSHYHNNAAHPLTMDLKDDVDTAEIFIIINQIAESLYTADKTFAKLDDILNKSKKTSKCHSKIFLGRNRSHF